MTYPTINEYLEAIQVPGSLSDPSLKAGKVATDSRGLPIVLGGGFALTFMVTSVGRKFAVRCFQKQSANIEERYRKIGETLSQIKNGCFVEFEFQPQGIRVNSRQYPVVKMAWAEGSTLGEHIEDNFSNRSALNELLQNFRRLEENLRLHAIAHGDLQNGNVLIQRDSPGVC